MKTKICRLLYWLGDTVSWLGIVLMAPGYLVLWLGVGLAAFAENWSMGKGTKK